MTDSDENLTISQMSDVVGVSANTLRYYERVGLIRPVARNHGRHRRYSSADVEWVRFLLRLRATGMPIARMREYAALREGGDATLRPRLTLLEAHGARVRDLIEQLHAHEAALRTKVAWYREQLSAADDGSRVEENDD